MAHPDDTTLPGEDFIDTLAPAPPAPPRVATRLQADAPDRLVFFFSGFDPKSATFYHRLFRHGIAQRNAGHDETLALGKRRRIGRWASVWTSLWRGAPLVLGGRAVTMRTRVHFMRWDDLVRQHWRRGSLTLVRDYWNVYARGLASGVLLRVWRAAPRAFWLATRPLAVCGLSFVLGLGVAGGLLSLGDVLSPAAVAIVGGAIGAALWRATAGWVDCEWLLRLCAFMRQYALGQAPALDARLDEMAIRLVEAVEARMRQPSGVPLREVMVVGYSSGSIMAASVLARAMPRLTDIVRDRRTSKGMTLSLATLGQCIPIAAAWPGAGRFRDELEVLAESPLLTWHDYSSVSDRAAFCRVPPWPESGRMKRRQLTAAFESVAGTVDFVSMRPNRRTMHLQYLQPARDRARSGIYDFFSLTCGPQTLAERHAEVAAANGSRS